MSLQEGPREEPEPIGSDLAPRLEWRPAAAADEELVEVATWVVAAWSQPWLTRPEAARRPDLVRRWRGFGTREGDLGVVVQTDSETVGVAWARLHGADEAGPAFVGAQVPEASLCVFDAYRRRGVGRALLARLVDALREAGFEGVSVSVEDGNAVVDLCSGLGFRTVGASGTAETMLLDLRG